MSLPANLLSSVREEMYGQINALGLVTVQRDVAFAERIPWRVEIETGDLVAPWLTIDFGKLSPRHDLGIANRVWEVDVDIFYITSLGKDVAGNLVAKDMDELLGEIEEAAMQITDMIKTGGTTYQTHDTPEVDCSSKAPMNDFFLNGNLAFYGSMVSAKVVVGYAS